MSQKSITLFASSPTGADEARFKADAADLIKTKMECEFGLDPRKPIDIGTLVASCRGLELTFQRRAQHTLADGTALNLFAVYSKNGDAPAVYLGNEVRCNDGQVVAQRLRSPESAEEFRLASTGAARHAKSANLFLSNWRDEAIVGKETAKKMVVLQFPSDMTAGISYRLSWYVREHMIGAGRVDLRPAMPGLCAALDAGDAEAKAKAEATVAQAKDTVELMETRSASVAFLRAEAKALGIASPSKMKKAELVAAIKEAAGLINWEPAEASVTADQMKAIQVAANLIDVGGLNGEMRLKKALREAGIRVPIATAAAGELAKPGSYRARLLAQAKVCVVAEPVTV